MYLDVFLKFSLAKKKSIPKVYVVVTFSTTVIKKNVVVTSSSMIVCVSSFTLWNEKESYASVVYDFPLASKWDPR